MSSGRALWQNGTGVESVDRVLVGRAVARLPGGLRGFALWVRDGVGSLDGCETLPPGPDQ